MDGLYQFQEKTLLAWRYADQKDAVKARKAAEEIHEDFLDWYYRTYPAAEAQKE